MYNFCYYVLDIEKYNLGAFYQFITLKTILIFYCMK